MRTVDGEPELDEISKALVADFGVSLEILHDLLGQEALVLVLQSLGQIPVEECLMYQETSIPSTNVTYDKRRDACV